MDDNVVKVTADKLSKYRALAIELQKCWDTKPVNIAPINIGALGTTLTSLLHNLKLVPNARFGEVKKNALLGTTQILRHALS